MGAIVSMIWALIGPTLVNLAITVGLPAVMEWLIKKGLPKSWADAILTLVKAALEQIKGIKKDESLPVRVKKAQVREVKKAAVREARHKRSGGSISQPSDTKGIE